MKLVNSINFEDKVYDLCLSEDGELLIAITVSNHLIFLKTKNLEKIGELAFDGVITGLSLSPDGQSAVFINQIRTNGMDVTLHYIDTNTVTEIKSFPLEEGALSITYCGSDTLAIGSNRILARNSIDFYKAGMTFSSHQLELPHKDFALNLAYSYSANIIAAAGFGATLWDLNKQSIIWDIIDWEYNVGSHNSKDAIVWETLSIALSKHGNYFAVGYHAADKGTVNKLCLYSTKSKEVIGWYCPEFEAIYSTAFSPDESLIAVSGVLISSQDEERWGVKLLDVKTGMVVDQQENKWARSLVFSRDGRFLITAGSPPDSVAFWQLDG